MMTVKQKGNSLKIAFIILIISITLIVSLLTIFLMPWLKGKAIVYVKNHSEYELKLGTVSFKGFTSFDISDIELRPKLNIKEFYEADNTERDWIAVKTHLSIKGIDWRSLLQHKHFYADTLIVSETDMYVYRDKKKPDASYKYKPLHSSILRNANFIATIPIIQLVKGKIIYDENPDKGERGQVIFGHLYATLYHLSTDSAYIAKESTVVLDGKGMIMDSIEGSVQYKFSNLNNKYDHFTFEGHAGPFSTNVLNKFMTPMASIKIKSGQIEKVKLFFSANDSIAIGTMNIDYNQLKVNVLNKNNKLAPIKTFLSNIMLNKDDKKANGEEKERGEINAIRDSGKSIYNYWWVAIKSGLMSSVVKGPLPEKKKP